MKRRSDIVDAVKKIILSRCSPRRIYLYGSEAAGISNAESDIDIAFDAPGFHDMDGILRDVSALETLVKIDVVNLHLCDDRFKNRVRNTGRVLFSADKKLRFEDSLYNFDRALAQLTGVLDRKLEFYREGFGDIYLDVVVKRFEFSYEIAWKTIKRWLDYSGITCLNPRACLKEAYQQKLIADEEIWLSMIEERNRSAHVYDESQIKEILTSIDSYRGAFEGLNAALHSAGG